MKKLFLILIAMVMVNGMAYAKYSAEYGTIENEEPFMVDGKYQGTAIKTKTPYVIKEEDTGLMGTINNNGDHICSLSATGDWPGNSFANTLAAMSSSPQSKTGAESSQSSVPARAAK